MSAYILEPEELAIAAQGIDALGNGLLSRTRIGLEPDLDRIIASLALENIASVSFRYSDEGRAVYAPIFRRIMTHLHGGGWTDGQIDGDAAAAKSTLFEDLPGLHDHVGTPEDYIRDCRRVPLSPQFAGPPQGWPAIVFARLDEVLASYRYQSCEHPEWDGCSVDRWTEEAHSVCAHWLRRSVIAEHESRNDADLDGGGNGGGNGNGKLLEIVTNEANAAPAAGEHKIDAVFDVPVDNSMLTDIPDGGKFLQAKTGHVFRVCRAGGRITDLEMLGKRIDGRFVHTPAGSRLYITTDMPFA